MRVAVPVWGERVSPVLDTASRLRIAEFEKGEKECENCFEVWLEEREICRRCARICGMRIDLIICGAVSRAMSTMLEAAGVRVISGIAGTYDNVFKAYSDGDLFSARFMMPGYSDGAED
jgi:predicted Fe-Mo cluster-binding NifX family protein